MIDFKNIDQIKRRVTKHTVEEGDFYTVSISTLEKEQLIADNKKATQEEMVVVALGAMLCDEKGKTLDLSMEELKSLPDVLFMDMARIIMQMATGKKKVN